MFAIRKNLARMAVMLNEDSISFSVSFCVMLNCYLKKTLQISTPL